MLSNEYGHFTGIFSAFGATRGVTTIRRRLVTPVVSSRAKRLESNMTISRSIATVLGMERLSGPDAFFLHLETPTRPLNVCFIVVLDTATMPGGHQFDTLRAMLSARVDTSPSSV